MLGNGRLLEQETLFVIQPASDQGGGHFQNVLPQFVRILLEGDGMHVHDGKYVAVDVLLAVVDGVDPVLHGAEVVAQV